MKKLESVSTYKRPDVTVLQLNVPSNFMVGGNGSGTGGENEEG